LKELWVCRKSVEQAVSLLKTCWNSFGFLDYWKRFEFIRQTSENCSNVFQNE
jgi:hypothetical protein